VVGRLVKEKVGVTAGIITRWGKMKVTQRLLDLGLDVNVNEGFQSIHDAIKWCKDFSLLFLECGADPGIWDNDGQTLASHEGNLSIVQQLLKFDVDVNSHDSQGQTPLQIVMEAGHVKVQKLLLEHGTERPLLLP